MILSFFISNEKNSSLFTAMLSNSKDIARKMKQAGVDIKIIEETTGVSKEVIDSL